MSLLNSYVNGMEWIEKQSPTQYTQFGWHLSQAISVTSNLMAKAFLTSQCADAQTSKLAHHVVCMASTRPYCKRWEIELMDLEDRTARDENLK